MYLKVIFHWIIILLPYCVFSQDYGVKFEQGITWDQVLQKANKENKYIFVDFYATWCVPCKQMDSKVYSKSKVGKIANNYFISIKVQGDTSRDDNENVKKWYLLARNFGIDYKIRGYPTYLFFSPNGRLVHRGIGYKDENNFLNLLEDARNPDFQVYTLLARYKKRKLSYLKMPTLAKQVKDILQDKKTAQAISKNYLTNYLYRLPEAQLLSKENLEFIFSNIGILTPKDKYFRVLRSHSDKIDSIIQRKGLAHSVLNSIISKNEIYSKIMPWGKLIDTEPDWMKLYRAIKKKYGANLAEENIINAKIYWFRVKNVMDSVIAYEIMKRDRFSYDTSFMGSFATNNLVYDIILKYSSDKEILNKALLWMFGIVEKYPNDPDFIDTYANILYKLGRKAEAVSWQEKALRISPNDKALESTLLKMKANILTW